MSEQQPTNSHKVVSNPVPGQLNVAETFSDGQEVYLNDIYYLDFRTSVLDVPKYGWKVKALVNGVATIEYQRQNVRLLMTLMLETKYLRKEI
jgi:hypothetical protein